MIPCELFFLGVFKILRGFLKFDQNVCMALCLSYVEFTEVFGYVDKGFFQQIWGILAISSSSILFAFSLLF
jgi:hypothetical protein